MIFISRTVFFAQNRSPILTNVLLELNLYLKWSRFNLPYLLYETHRERVPHRYVWAVETSALSNVARDANIVHLSQQQVQLLYQRGGNFSLGLLPCVAGHGPLDKERLRVSSLYLRQDNNT